MTYDVIVVGSEVGAGHGERVSFVLEVVHQVRRLDVPQPVSHDPSVPLRRIVGCPFGVDSDVAMPDMAYLTQNGAEATFLRRIIARRLASAR